MPHRDTHQSMEFVSFPCGEVTLRGDHWPADARGRQVLFLHGGGQTRHSWGGAARRVAALGWETTAVDLRGHGDSDWSHHGRYGVAANAADIECVIGQLGRGLVLVGASLGGLTALSVQASDPSAARAIVLVDIVPRTSPEGVRRIRAFMSDHLDGFENLEEAAHAISKYTRRPLQEDLSGLSKNLRLRDDGRWYWHWDPRMVPAQRDIDIEPPVDPERLLHLARSISVPTLIVRGGASDVVTERGAEELQEALPNAEIAVVEGAGHMVAGDNNDAFVEVVVSFLHTLNSSS